MWHFILIYPARLCHRRLRQLLSLLGLLVGLFAFWQAGLNGLFSPGRDAVQAASGSAAVGQRQFRDVAVAQRTSVGGVRLAGRRIDQMRPVDWVLAGNPSGERDTEFGTEIDPPHWRLLHLEAPKEDGSRAEIWMLRPVTWLEEQWRDQYAVKVTSLFEVPGEGPSGAGGAASESETVQLIAIEHDELTDPQTGARLQGPGVWVPQYDEKLLSSGTLYVSMPECGIDGHARVLSIGECPQVSPRPGPEFQLVTATFHHHGATIIDVGVSGLADTIGSTPNHPFWSEDKQDFVRADELHVGEQLRQTDGSLASVTSLTPRAGLHDVFNLEVQVDHTYHVSASGVLVHNASKWKCYEVGAVAAAGANASRLLTEFAGKGGRVRFADGVLGKTAIEAKRIGNWSTSLYNPANMGKALGARKQFSLATQMRDYSKGFDNVTYYTNNLNMKKHLESMANLGGFQNVTVRLFP